MLHSLTLLALALLPSLPAQQTGAVSEAEFKAMHELKQGAAPVLTGTPVEVGGAKCYLSLPKTPRAGSPAVVVIHEWYGLNDHIKHWADRLASDGYAALAVDLYGGVVAKNSDEAMAAMKAVDGAKAVAVMQAAEKFLREDARVKAKKVASLGWCFGGGQSFQLALNSATLDACVLYYGHLETDPAKLAPLKAPVLAIFGSKDGSIHPADVAAWVDGMVKAEKEHRVMIFPAVHAFANPSNAKYDEQSASVAWENVRMFLAEKLK
jgi:carboxymethylenebutenolidase